MFPHLHEVGQTGYSTQVPEKDHQQQAWKLGQADCRAVGPKERQLFHMIANTQTGHRISLSK